MRILAMRAKRTPDLHFLSWQDDSYSFADCWEISRRLGGLLTKLGLTGNGARVASYLPNCPEMLWTWFASYVTGSVFVPLNRAHKGELLVDMIRRAGPQVLITDAVGLNDLPDPASIGIHEVIITGENLPERCISFDDVKRSSMVDPYFADPAELATLMYTSGTTGRSKCVRLPHNIYARNAARHAEAMGYVSEDVFHVWFPQFHIWGSLTTAGLMCAGASIALFPSFSASRFWEQVEQTGATWFGGFANILQILMSVPHSDGDKSTLRAGHAGMVPGDIKRRFEARFHVKLYDEYGMTEVEPLTLPAKRTSTPADSVGVANPDFELIVADPDGLPVPTGTQGQILAKPLVPNVMMHGYENDDAATSSAMSNGWFRTGDVGSQDADGYFYIHGRLKHMIRRGGESVSSTELEELIGRHADVDQIACVGIPCDFSGEEIKAVVVLGDDSSVMAPDLHAWCERKMARFMVPRYIELVDTLPRNAVGKIEKESLKSVANTVWDAKHRSISGEK